VITPNLVESTGDLRIDRVLQAVVQSFVDAMPGQVIGCFLLGSHGEGRSHSRSDVDIAVLLEEPRRAALVHRVVESCTRKSPIPVDIMALTPNEFVANHPALVPAFKVASRIVWGRDLREELPWPDAIAYTRHAIELAVSCMAAIRGVESLVEPLQYPDPGGEFFGYDGLIRGRLLAPRPNSRGLTVTISRIVIAHVAVQAGKFCASREEHLRLYRTETEARSMDLIDFMEQHCRKRWHHEIPDTPGDRTKLREHCARTLDFEQYSVESFQRWMRSRPAS
jgi:hypothetical protein